MTTNCAVMAPRDVEKVWAALDDFRIEVPSWGFANTGTRFGKVLQDGAATNIEEKFADAAQVNDLTGASPTVALHVLWDLPRGVGGRFRSAFWQDVRPIVRDWREARGLPAEPLEVLAESGYVEQITQERGSKNACRASSYA